jgi:hypothetical protein
MERRCDVSKMIWATVGALAVAIATGNPVQADDPWRRVQLRTGMRELSMWGALDVDEGGQTWLWLGGDLGFMVSPRHEIGPTMDLQLWWFDWESAAGGACGGFYRYHVPVRSRRVEPFLGVRAVGYLGEYREWDAEVRAEGGLWHYMTESTAINLTGFYGRRFGPHCEWWYCPDDRDRFGMSVGLSVFF